jgi:hypothetical protein
MNLLALYFYLTDTASHFGVKEKKMSYIITSEVEVCNKKKGEPITEKELLNAGANIEALIAGNHIKATGGTIKPVIQEGADK